MLVREQTGRPGVGLDRIKEGGRDIPRQQPVTILGKRRGMPDQFEAQYYEQAAVA